MGEAPRFFFVWLNSNTLIMHSIVKTVVNIGSMLSEARKGSGKG